MGTVRGYRITVAVPGHGTVTHTAGSILACWQWYEARVRPEYASRIVIERLP